MTTTARGMPMAATATRLPSSPTISADGDAAEAALALGVVVDCLEQDVAAEIRPEHGRQVELRVRELPQHEVADTLLAGCADQQIGIRHAGRVELARQLRLRDVVRRELAVLDARGQSLRGAHDLRTAAVTDHQVQLQSITVRGQALDLCHSRARAGWQPVGLTEHAYAHALRLQLRTLFHEIALQQPHERGDLACRPIPVLLRERIEREHAYAGLDGALDGLAHRAHARRMTPKARQAASARPAAVAIHDDRNVNRWARAHLHSQ